MKFNLGDRVEAVISGQIVAVEIEGDGSLTYRIKDGNGNLCFAKEGNLFPYPTPEETRL